MAPLRRLGAVEYASAGIVIGTGLAALRAPVLLVLAIACVPLLIRLPRVWLFGALLVAACVLAPLRGLDARPSAFDPFSRARAAILRPLVGVLPGDAGAVMAGLTLGDSSYFSARFKDAMRASSTTHLVALSGFNVMLILGCARRLLRGRVTRRAEISAGICLLATFVALAGAQPSLVRAALMGTALMVGEAISRRVAPARLLLVTAAFMLLVQPSWILHLGFTLSFASTWALLAIFGDMEALLVSGSRIAGVVRSAVLPTAVAQAGVAPVLLSTTGSVMLAGLVANPLILPVTPLLTALAGVMLAIAHAAPALASVMAPLVDAACFPVTALISLMARVPMSISWDLSPWVAVSAYATSVAWSLRRHPELW